MLLFHHTANEMRHFTCELNVNYVFFSVLDEVSVDVKGLATVAVVDCSSKEGKKICKKMKVSFFVKYYIPRYSFHLAFTFCFLKG